MTDWSTLKKLIWLRIIKGGGSALRTVTGAIVHVTNALALPAEALTVNVEPIQAGTGDPSPDNVRPISGRTSATVTRTGRNLFDKSTGIQLTNNNVLVARNQGFGVPFKFKKGVTYTISCNCTTRPTAIYIIEPYVSTVITQVSENYSISFTPSADTEAGINFYWSSANGGRPTDATDIMIEVGSVKHDFEPYAGNTYTIQLGDTVYGGTLDVTGGVLTVTWAGKVLDGVVNKVKMINTSYIGNVVTRAYKGAFSTNAKNPVNARSETAVYSTIGTDIQRFYIISNNGETNIFILNSLTGITSEDTVQSAEAKMNAYLAEHPFKFVYQLASPIEITLTPTQIDMLLGENNLWADAGDSTLTYYAEGEASTSEALGILLGGTYNNPGGADDASDDEALGILLGGT